MTFQERNQKIDEFYQRFKNLHDDYTSSTKILTDQDWEVYIHSMEAITQEYRGTNLYDLAGAMQMVFLNDTEYINKQLKKVGRR